MDTKNIFSISRLEAIIDGIFATSMTIIIFSISMPSEVDAQNSYELLSVLNENSHLVYIYFVGFLILSSIWIGSVKQIKHVKYADMTFLWLNLVSLMFVVLIPFCVDLISDFPHFTISQSLFHLDFLVIGILSVVKWKYLFKHPEMLVEEETTLLSMKNENRYSYHLIIVAVIGILLSFFIPNWSSATYMLLLVYKIIYKKNRKGECG